MSRRYLFVGGGSGGHTVPLIAVRQSLLTIEPDADIRMLTSDKRIDREFMERERLSYDTVPYPRMGFSFIPSFLRNYKTSARILEAFKPDVIFSKGGALSLPVCIAAYGKNIPIVQHESDIVMGNANRFVSMLARKVCLGFPSGKESAKFFLTGNPVRTQMTQGTKEEGLEITGLSGTKPVLLISGGSQGAQTINEVIWSNLDTLLSICDVAHLTGIGKKRDIARPGYWSSEMSSDQLHHLYAIADLAISRAGAGNISELAANAIPTILVPIRGLAHDHQYKNAVVARDNGGCVLVLQEEIGEKLISEISRILGDDGLRSQMSKKITNLYQPNAAVRIAKIIVECVASRKNLP